MRKSIAVCLLATFAAFTPFSLLAGPITIPSGLNPGDQYRLAFVTSTTRDATSSNIADYNSFVTSDANSVPALAALGTTWKAIASTATVAAEDNTSTNPGASAGVPIYLLDGTLFASNNAALWAGASSTAPDFNITENGTAYPVNILGLDSVWTGTTVTGLSAGVATLGDAFSGATVTGIVDASIFINQSDAWVYDDFEHQNLLYPLYAISDVLTVPEPSTAALAYLAAAGLAVTALRRRSGSR